MALSGFPVAGIGDEIVRLRRPVEADLAAIAAACRDPEIQRWTRVPENYTLADAGDWLERSRLEDEAGRELHLLVTSPSSRDLLGSIGVHRLNEDGECDIGYWLASAARGSGVATGAVRLLCGWLFESPSVHRIVIRAEPTNTASCAVAERAGFQFEGILRSHHVIKGRRRDDASYSLLRGELADPRTARNLHDKRTAREPAPFSDPPQLG